MEGFVEKFQRDGFAVIENFLTDEEVDLMKKECGQILDGMSLDEHRVFFSTRDVQARIEDQYFLNSGDKISYFFEKNALNDNGEVLVEKHLAINKIGHALHAFVPTFRKITHSDKVKTVLKLLQYTDPVVMQSMYIFKQPFIGGEVMPHQDATYLFTEPVKVVGFWMALDDATAENGCLSFIPGSHSGGLYGNYRFVRKENEDRVHCGYEGDNYAHDATTFVLAPVKKGSLVLIDGLVVHQSEQNSCSKARHAYAFHVFDEATSKWSERNWLQPTAAQAFTHLYNVLD